MDQRGKIQPRTLGMGAKTIILAFFQADLREHILGRQGHAGVDQHRKKGGQAQRRA